MKSPFPGMDPYIEACGFWRDFHHGLIEGIVRVLSSNLPDNYIARTRGRTYVVPGEELDEKEAFIEIFELHPERRLVTSIEVLSPSNKRKDTAGWDKYLRQRQTRLRGDTSLVEIDLLRGGTRMPMLDTWPNAPYTLLVARRKQQACQVWPAHFQRPVPAIPIPLLEPHPDVRLELQPIIDGIYASRRYHLDIDYRKPLQPPLSDE